MTEYWNSFILFAHDSSIQLFGEYTQQERQFYVTGRTFHNLSKLVFPMATTIDRNG